MRTVMQNVKVAWTSVVACAVVSGAAGSAATPAVSDDEANQNDEIAAFEVRGYHMRMEGEDVEAAKASPVDRPEVLANPEVALPKQPDNPRPYELLSGWFFDGELWGTGSDRYTMRYVNYMTDSQSMGWRGFGVEAPDWPANTLLTGRNGGFSWNGGMMSLTTDGHGRENAMVANVARKYGHFLSLATDPAEHFETMSLHDSDGTPREGEYTTEQYEVEIDGRMHRVETHEFHFAEEGEWWDRLVVVRDPDTDAVKTVVYDKYSSPIPSLIRTAVRYAPLETDRQLVVPDGPDGFEQAYPDSSVEIAE